MYSSPADVRNALDPTGSTAATSAASLDDLRLNDAIREADSTIDANIGTGTRYQVPQDETEPGVAQAPVRYWSRNIAAYLATLTFRRGKDLPQDDPVRLRYTDTMSLLVAIRDGKARPSLPIVVTPPGEGGDVFVQNPYTGNLFSPRDFGLVAEGTAIRRDVWPG